MASDEVTELPEGMLDSRVLIAKIHGCDMPAARRLIQKDRNAWGKACVAAAEARERALREALRSAKDEMLQASHYGHSDPKGTAGANCPACHAMRRGFAVIDAALATQSEAGKGRENDRQHGSEGFSKDAQSVRIPEEGATPTKEATQEAQAEGETVTPTPEPADPCASGHVFDPTQADCAVCGADAPEPAGEAGRGPCLGYACQWSATLKRDDGKPICVDGCIASIVDALNRAGIRTQNSCCGHRVTPGNIMLDDGRELLVMPDFETARMVERFFPPVYVEDNEAMTDRNIAGGVIDEQRRQLAALTAEVARLKAELASLQQGPLMADRESWRSRAMTAESRLAQIGEMARGNATES